MADRLSRRLLVLRTVALGGAGAGLTACVPPPPGYYPQPVRGTGLTDADPNDGVGNGRGGGYRRGTGLTDSDPNDGAGNGRGGSRRSRTDSDPHDAPGRGRY